MVDKSVHACACADALLPVRGLNGAASSSSAASSAAGECAGHVLLSMPVSKCHLDTEEGSSTGASYACMRQ